MLSSSYIHVKPTSTSREWADFQLPGLVNQVRIAEGGDESFVLNLSTQRHEEKLARGLVDVALVISLAAMQAKAQFVGYDSAYPGAERWIVCGAGHAPVGYFIINLADDHWRVVDIVIKHELRGHGIGTWLLRNLQMEAGRTGVPMRLSVVQSSQALYLYTRLGFAIIGENGVRFEMEWASPAGTTEAGAPG